MSRILVTGGCGFIGNKLVTALAENNEHIYVIDNLCMSSSIDLPKSINFIEGDIRDIDLINKVMKDVNKCYHLAALTDVNGCELNPVECTSVNTYGSQVIFDSALNNNVKVIYASSAAVYGENIDSSKNLEKSTVNPKSIYGISKWQTEILAAFYKMQKGLDVLGLRFFNVYGYPFNQYSAYAGVIRVFFESIIKGIPLEIRGLGSQLRDFISVHDVVNICINIMDKDTSSVGVLNVGTGVDVSINELAKNITVAMNAKNTPIFYVAPSKSEIGNSVANIDLLKSFLPEFKPTTLENGIEYIRSKLNYGRK